MVSNTIAIVMHSVVAMAGDVVGRQVTSGSLLTAFSSVVSSSFSGFTATWAFIATYIDVPAYGIPSVRRLHGVLVQNIDARAHSCQLRESRVV